MLKFFSNLLWKGFLQEGTSFVFLPHTDGEHVKLYTDVNEKKVYCLFKFGHASNNACSKSKHIGRMETCRIGYIQKMREITRTWSNQGCEKQTEAIPHTITKLWFNKLHTFLY